jgi:hypothetical protein
MNILYDLVPPNELTDYVRAFNNEVLRNRFALAQILPNRDVADLEYRIRTGTLTDVDVAEYRAWDTQPTMTGRPGISRKRGELPPVSRQIPLLEEQSLRLRMLESGSNDPIVTAIYDDAERMLRAVEGRVELARGDVLVDGIVTLNENGVNITVDYGMPAGHKVNAPIAWTTANKATALPITDLLGWLDTYVTDTGGPPRGLLMSRARMAGLLVNQEVRSYAQGGDANRPDRVNLATLQNLFADQGIPPLLDLGVSNGLGPFYDTTVRVNGALTPIIPNNVVIFVPQQDEPVGNTFWGITAEATRLLERQVITAERAPGIIALALQNDNPVQTFTLATAIALPTIANPELLFTATVA